ncbi:hypothetical protein [Terriglobus sp. TAA 43]|uniref:hypothetical protein n=1 Tax=Terriglobus sp. TAA 43 TaxID=278961 RepID=UPI0006469828|nr:hypothetical protein [Terriglobus sp. TAA 43]
MVSIRAKARCFWFLLALTGLFGMFTVQSTYTLKFNHIPGRLNARAGGTVASMSQRERVEKVAAEVAQAEESPALDLTIAMEAPQPHITPLRQRTDSVPPASPGLWPPPLLFRPPPALSVA